MNGRKKEGQKDRKTERKLFILESNEGEYLKVLAICPDGISK